MTPHTYEEARSSLLLWFDRHKRDLPWRHTHDPYAIWISEIMLQQTRVAAVLDHYARWMKRFPTISALAGAEEADVLTLWSGLGYYRRARMLHRAAQAVVAEHGGVLPRTAAELRDLPGIGEYTSAAIASIAFGEPIAVVDGNVERVVMRLAALAPAQNAETNRASLLVAQATSAPAQNEKTSSSGVVVLARQVRTCAQELVDKSRPGDSNQAMMELGATVCLPKAPLCLHCPVQPWCRTRGEHVTTRRKAQHARDIAYALLRRGEQVLLRQRASDVSLMAGMWELPELAEIVADADVVLRLRHAITVTNYAVSIVQLSEERATSLAGTLRWTDFKELPHLPLTGLTRKVLRSLELWPPS